MATKSTWRHLFVFTKSSHIGTLVAAVSVCAATAGLKTILAVFLGKIFDVISDFGTGKKTGSEAMDGVRDWCLVLVGVGFGNWLVNSIFLALWIVFGELQAASVREDMLASLIRYELSWFDYQEQGVSSLLVRIQTQTRELQLATSQLFGLFVSDTMTSLASFGLAVYYSWRLTLVLLATLPVSLAILTLVTRPLEPAIQEQRRHLASASKHVTSSVTAVDLVNVFNGHDYELRQYTTSIRQAARAYLIQARCNSIQMGYVSFWVIAIFAVGFWYGLSLVQDGLPPGSILTTFYATLASFQGVESLMPHWLVLSKGMSAGAFLKAVVTENSMSGPQRQKQQSTGGMIPGNCSGRVELSNVSFAYPSTPDNHVVSRVSLIFPAGETIFIVGKSGSGKSTIGSLVANLYEPLAGNIQVDDRPMRALDLEWVHNNITLVQQTSAFFNDTIFQNVALGSHDPNSVTEQQVLSACKAAILQPTISALPQGLQTNVGPDGHTLSGGQKQRLKLARAFMRDAPVMVLDEITSGLDHVTRSLVFDSIRSRRRNKTTIFITHDTSQIGDDDFVYVMEDHQVVQEGLKKDLLRHQGGHFEALATRDTAITTNVKNPLTLTIDVKSTDTAHLSTLSPSTPMVRTKSSRVADYLLDRLDSRALTPGNPHMSSRIPSIGPSMDYVVQPRRDDTIRMPADSRSRSSPPPDPDHAPGEWTNETKRFSRYLSDKFSLGNDQRDLHNSVTPSATFFPHKTSQENLLRHSFTSGFSFSQHNSVPTSLDLEAGAIEMAFGQIDIQRPAQDEETSRFSLTNEEPYQCNEEGHDGDHNYDRDEPPLDDDFPKPKAIKKRDSIFTTLKTVWPGIGPRDKATLIIGVISSIIGAAAIPAFSYSFAQLLSVMTAPGDKVSSGKEWAGIMLALALIDGACWGGSRYLLERVGESWVNSIRTEALRRILLQPMPWFRRSSNSPSRISECLDRNAEEMRNIVGKFIPIIVAVAIIVCVSVLWALAVSWKLALVTLTPYPAMLGAVKIFTILSSRWEAQCNEAAEEVSATATEILVNIRLVRTFNLEHYFSQRYQQGISRTLLVGFKRALFTCGAYGLYQSLNYAMTSLAFYYGTLLLADKKELDVADVIQVINLSLFSIGTATGILSSIPQLTMAQATASRIISYINMSTEPPEGQKGSTKLVTPLPVTMKSLSFSRNRNIVLHGVSLDIQPGRCTAIVGHSGCGKSTILSLILGLEAVNADGLEYASVPSKHVDVGNMRRHPGMMSYVPQASFLFPASISDNITYGLPVDSTLRHPENVADAARTASIHDWIVSLPQGYDTLVGDGGQTVSGGQAQRLSIARALVRHPSLLVLDEPTSALDAENAAVIQETVRNAHGADRAVIFVTHSRKMMQAADYIIMLGEGGVVLQQGKYNELVNARGPFAHLVGSNDDVV
ncbi:ATP-binding cassette, subfamily B (MDR/TAP), member 1 [Geosmithia morbida]|uniref:ATP-binding cassette, subfamily B (MDR/TAP), member 1 n=1 Tax=Geosmithia morbida TaxID=1094350 RepID=A0A9P4YRD4_9HYPO|nr:ATP-binding cassette, subfamily B (MDR/TAP), member 1 [Geosmithia morbida]KAF4120384.1 ATP-binding cassette, subfamily B (MDR/TAP), member 1 [Geosmithia morbida]